MTTAEVISLLEENQDERGIKHWERLKPKGSTLKSYGIGLTRLRKIGKQIGKDRTLAETLWKTNLYEAKVLALLVDDPKQITREQAERQVEELGGGYLVHVFSSCDATLAKTAFVVDLSDDWIKSKDPVRRRCGYGLLYETSKNNKKSAPDDPYFLNHIADIDKARVKANPDELLAMAGALMGIGKRNKKLNAAALKVARAIGPVEFSEDGRCDPFDAVKHLTSDYLKKKLGL